MELVALDGRRLLVRRRNGETPVGDMLVVRDLEGAELARLGASQVSTAGRFLDLATAVGPVTLGPVEVARCKHLLAGSVSSPRRGTAA